MASLGYKEGESSIDLKRSDSLCFSRPFVHSRRKCKKTSQFRPNERAYSELSIKMLIYLQIMPESTIRNEEICLEAALKKAKSVMRKPYVSD